MGCRPGYRNQKSFPDLHVSKIVERRVKPRTWSLCERPTILLGAAAGTAVHALLIDADFRPFLGQDAGHAVTVASPKGGAPPIDGGSEAENFLTAHTKRHSEDAESKQV